MIARKAGPLSRHLRTAHDMSGITEQQSSTPSSAELAQREGLRKRAAVSPVVTATLLALAVLAMAMFRYVQALS
jgi:hypothetical protein